MKFFVSYSRSVTSDVEKVVDLLKAVGHDVWWDVDILPIQDWWSTILDEIETCEIFLFVVSEKAVQSPYCLAELAYATGRNRPILPFIVDDHKQYKMPPEVTPMRNQWFVYDGDPARMLDRILGACDALKWEKYPDIAIPRPPEPNKGSGSLVKQFQQAVSLAEDGQFKEAIQRFRNVASLDQNEWGADCREWESRIQSYRPIAELAEHPVTRDRARAKWDVHKKQFGTEFDPLSVREKLSSQQQNINKPQPIATAPKSAPSTPAPPPTTTQGSGIYDLIDQFYTAYGAEDWQNALALLVAIEKRRDIPGMFTPAEYRTAIETKIQEAEATQQNNQAAAREYPALHIMAKHEARDRVRHTLRRFRQQYPGYDPDNLWEQFAPWAVEMLPSPFDWIEIPGGNGILKTRDKDVTLEIPADTYWMAKYPVTNAQFAKFIEAGGYKTEKWWTEAGWQQRKSDKWTEPRHWTGNKWNGSNQPVVGVSWYEAVAFCLWLSDATGDRIMLPTEAQWQYAAQGTDGRDYPWGKEWDSQRCQNNGGTSLVTKYEGKGDSPFGVVDMAGNVWEWCLTENNRGNNDINGTDERVLRGGSWNLTNSDFFRCVIRYRDSPRTRYSTIGFRLALSH